MPRRCPVARAEYAKEWRKRNNAQVKANQKRWYAANKDRVLGARRKWPGRIREMVNSCRTRANKKGVVFALDQEWEAEVCASLEVRPICQVTGSLLELNTRSYRGGHHPLAPSIDRIDPRKGYTPDNVRVVCCWVNLAKHTLDDKTFREWCRAVVEAEEEENESRTVRRNRSGARISNRVRRDNRGELAAAAQTARVSWLEYEGRSGTR